MPTYIVNPDVGANYAPVHYAKGMEDLHIRLRDARKAKKLTQATVAKLLGISRVSVTQWESGLTRPDSARYAEIAGLYAVDLDWLMNGEGTGPDGNPPSAEDIRQAEELKAEIMALSPEDRAYIRGRIDERKERARARR